MKVRPVRILAAAVVLACSHPLDGQGGIDTISCTEVNWPVLQSTDPAYRDAIALARTLVDSGVSVQCIAPSKKVAMFEGQAGAALYYTNRGTFEALFLPSLRRFDGLQVIERDKSGRHLYSFVGEPKPWAANLIHADRPLYFIKHLNRLVVTQDKELSRQLAPILAGR